MHKTIILLATLSFIPTPILALTTPFKQAIVIAQANPTSIAQEITVKVYAGNSSGSGILISRNGDRYTLLTNAHVISRGKTYRIATNDAKEYTAKLLKTGQSFQGDDLALLEFSSKNNYKIAQWADLKTVKKGDSVYSAGFATGKKDLSITKGEVTLMTSQPLQGGYQIGFSNNTQQGMSGGALLNAEGKLLGILGLGSLSILNDTYQYKDGTQPPKATLEMLQRYSFAIPSTTATLFAQNNTKPPTNTAQQKKPATEKTTKKPYTGIVKKIDDIAQAVTVRIDSQKNGNGSGAIIAKQGDTYYVLTAHHVIKNQDKYTVTIPDGQVYKLTPQQIITISADNDLAVVKFQSQKNYPIAQIASYEPGNQWLFISGFPGSDKTKQRSLSAGVVQEKEQKEFRTKDKYSLQGGRGLVYTNLSLPGMSGGPVFDHEGRLVGINTGAENETILTEGDVQEINFGLALGVPITTFLGLADRSGIPTQQLKIVTTPPSYLQDKPREEIKRQLFTFPQPGNNGTAKDWLNYGNELWRSFQYEKAVTAFSRAIKLLEGKSTGADKEMLAIAYFGQGLALGADGKYQQAVKALNKTTTINPRFVQAWRWQGKVLNQLKQDPEALKAYQKAIQLDKKNFVFYVEQGNVLTTLKRYPDAITSYSEAVKLKPEHTWAYNSRGIAYAKLKQYDKAIADYNQVINLDPKSTDAYGNRANVYVDLKQYDKAIADYNQAINLDPQLAPGFYSRGNAYKDMGKYDKAIADYNQAINLDPKFSLAYYNRANTYNNLQQYDKAIADYSQAIVLDPKNPNAYTNRGNAYDDLKQSDKAIADYNQAIKLDPKNTLAYYNRGTTYRNLKQYDKAIADYTQTIQLNPKFPQAYNNRGISYLSLKQYDKALPDFEKAVELYNLQGNIQRANQIQEVIQQVKKMR